MFGFTGESPKTVVRKRGYMTETQARWPFLTYFDQSTIKNERQLATMVSAAVDAEQSVLRFHALSWR